MELIWNELPAGRLIYSGVTQALIEGDLPLPEGRTAAEALSYTGEVSVSSASAGPGRVELEGVVSVELICNDGSVFAFSSRAAFSHAIAVEGAEAGMAAEVFPSLQSLEVAEEGGRFTMHAVVDLACRVTSGGRTLGGVKAAEPVEYDSAALTLCTKAQAAAGTLRIREEIDAPFAARVVYSQLQAQIREAAPTHEGILLEGVLYLSALVEGRTGGLSQLLQAIPFSETVEGQAQGPLWARAVPAGYEVRAAGEFGVVVADVQLSYQVFRKEGRSVSVALDAFSPKLPFGCSHSELRLSSCEGAVSHRSPVTEAVALPEGLPEVQRVVYCSSRPLVTAQGVEAGELKVEGLLAVRILYLGEGGGVFAFGEDLPFNLSLPAPNATEAVVWAGASASASGGGRSMELTATLNLWAELYATHTLQAVTGIEEREPEEPPHGLIAYFAAPGDTLYSLAKRYNTSRSALQALHPGLEERLQGGEKIVFLN